MSNSNIVLNSYNNHGQVITGQFPIASNKVQCSYVYGCTDPTAANYNALAQKDDGSCFAAIRTTNIIYAYNGIGFQGPASTLVYNQTSTEIITYYDRVCGIISAKYSGTMNAYAYQDTGYGYYTEWITTGTLDPITGIWIYDSTWRGIGPGGSWNDHPYAPIPTDYIPGGYTPLTTIQWVGTPVSC